MRQRTVWATGGLATTMAAGALVSATAGATTATPDSATAATAEGGRHGGAGTPHYSFVPGPGPWAHRPVIKVTLKRLPTGARTKVSITRRTATFAKPRNPDRRLRRSAELTSGVKHVFDYCRKAGRYYVIGQPVRAKGTVWKAHTARVIVNRHHGVHVKLRYYPKGHKHHPVPGVNAPGPGQSATPLPKPSSQPGGSTGTPGGGSPSANPTTPPTSAPTPSSSPTPTAAPATAYPSAARGNAASYDQGQGYWKQCTITWSFDPGPTAQLGADPQTEVKLLRGILNSITQLAGYRFTEVSSGAQLQITMLDHVSALPGGIVPSGVTIPVPQDGAPFTSATVQFDGASLLSAASLPRVQVRQNLYAHEIGHALGLNHTQDPTQIMSPTVPNELGWGAGDVAALKALQRRTQC